MASALILGASSLHGTAVVVGGRGVLLLGPSASGKSDLALRLIDRGAVLLADDYVLVSALDGELHLAAPPAIAGLLELRGVGLLRLPFVDSGTARLLVDLARPPERLPEPGTTGLHGVYLPRIGLRAFEASAPLKVERALAHFCGLS